jgi:diguanylate cyclase (GGDEF)-like protein
MRPAPVRASHVRTLVVLVAWVALIGAVLAGLFRPLDDSLRDQRFGAASRVASGDIVFLDIDKAALDAVGVWPWPRSVHAHVLDELMRLGAYQVVFDVDFSVPSSPVEDAAFERALRDAGNFAMLAAFRQQTVDGRTVENLPLPRFAQYADMVTVNVVLDPDGVVRTYPLVLNIGGRDLPSVAALYANVEAEPGSRFGIDYSIDPLSVPRLSVADLLTGRAPPEAIAGKRVVIGASAVELKDYFVVPRYGVLPGALLQILAAETLEQHRALVPVGWQPIVAALLLIAIVGLVVRRRAALWIIVPAALATSAVAEIVALLMQQTAALLLDTGALHIGLAVLALQAVVEELSRRAELKRAAEDRLRYLGRHDPLTGALNRTALADLAEARLAQGEEIAIAIIDLRRFRAINDTLGHAQGDLLLRQVVDRLRAMDPDAVARLGGDSFALLGPGMPADRLRGYCQSIVGCISSPYQLDASHEVRISASAGATTSALSGRDAGTLLSHADMALSSVKRAPGDRVAIFDPAMDVVLRDHQALDAALHEAIGAGAFAMVYQPQVDLASGRMVGVEALVRWNDGTLGSVPPQRFVAAAEETGQIVELGRWTLRTACRDAARWPGQLRVAVNVSPVQFELSDIVADIGDALAQSGLAPERLEIEITEGSFVRDAAAVSATLRQLRTMGIGVALDDFGTGYSSLAYLGKLPLDKIKIDQSFVRRLPRDGEAAAIVRTVLSLCAALGKTVVAEGIEIDAQRDYLREGGCQVGQGYLFSRPLPAAALEALIGQPAVLSHVAA